VTGINQGASWQLSRAPQEERNTAAGMLSKRQKGMSARLPDPQDCGEHADVGREASVVH